MTISDHPYPLVSNTDKTQTTGKMHLQISFIFLDQPPGGGLVPLPDCLVLETIGRAALNI